MQINKNGSIGYCYVRSGKFSLTSDTTLIKLKDEYKNTINLNNNKNLLTIQISNMGFDYLKKLNKERLNEIELYLNFEQEHNEQKENEPKYRLMEYFELVKFKSTPSNYEPDNKNKAALKYPLIGARKVNNGVVKFIDVYNIDTNGEDYLTLCKQGDGGSGYCFVHNGKFSLCSTMYLLRLKEEYKNKIDLKVNAELLTLQITNMGFGFTKGINQERLNEIKIYLKFSE